MEVQWHGICSFNRTVRPHDPGLYDTGPHDPRPWDYTTIRSYDPGPKFEIYGLRHFLTTDGLVHTQDISTCQSFLGHVEFRVFVLS